MPNLTPADAKAQLLDAVRTLLATKPCKLRIADVCPNLAPDEVGLSKAEAYEVYTLIANLDLDWEKTNTIAGRQRAWNKPGTDGSMGGGRGGNHGKWDVSRLALNIIHEEFAKSLDTDTATAATLSRIDAFKTTPNTFKWLCDNYEMVTDHLKDLKAKKGKKTVTPF